MHPYNVSYEPGRGILAGGPKTLIYTPAPPPFKKRGQGDRVQTEIEVFWIGQLENGKKFKFPKNRVGGGGYTLFFYKQCFFSGQAEVLLKNLENEASFFSKCCLVSSIASTKQQFLAVFDNFLVCQPGDVDQHLLDFSRISAQCCL